MLRRMIAFSLLMVVAANSTYLLADDRDSFQPESAGECLDRFQMLVYEVSNRYAAAGKFTETSIDQPHLSRTTDWFVIEDDGKKSSKKSYSEARAVYPHAVESNFWEKRFVHDGKVFRGVGEYLEELTEIKRSDDTEEVRYLTSKNVVFPNVFVLAFVPATKLSAESGQLIRFINEYKALSEEKKGDDILGVFYTDSTVIEVLFSHENDFLPVGVKGYFNTSVKGREPKKEEHSILWYESVIKWEKNEKTRQWLPIRVEAVQHRRQKTVAKGREFEAVVAWNTGIEADLLSESNVELLPLKGPIADIREKLLQDLSIREKKSP